MREQTEKKRKKKLEFLSKVAYNDRNFSLGDQLQNQISNDQLFQMNSRKRVTNWATENADNYELFNALKRGIYLNKTVFDHKFRDRKSELNLSESEFYNRKFMPSKKRAKILESKHKALFLQKGKNPC